MGPGDYDVPNKGVGSKWLWPCCLTFVVFVVVPFGIIAYQLRPTYTDRRADWPVFYETYVSKFATIPAEATIIEATEVKDFMFGGGFTVVFTLPETKAPEEWMLVLTSGEGVGLREHKVSALHYEVSGTGDIYWLQYFPEEKHYVLRNQWD